MKKQGRHSETHYGTSIKIAASAMLVVVMLAALAWGVVVLKNPKTLPFRQVKISANNAHIKMTALRTVVATHLEGGFFSLQVESLRRSFLNLPWVKGVSFRRIWPDQLIVNVQERHAIGRWGDQLISAEGKLFRPAAASIPQGLPLLEGPADSLKEVLKQYQYLRKSLSTIGVTISELQLSPRHAWHLVLDGHLDVILGRDNVERRFKRFIALYRKVVGAREKDVVSIDLRYPNGLAIKWKARSN